jgi:uncharacterized membrane protein YqaE (UPF0057 family)
MKVLRILLAIALPPVSILLTYGVSATLLINILLTVLGWVPGIIHALWAIAKHDENANRQAGNA